MTRRARISLAFAAGILLVVALRTAVSFRRFSRVERRFASVQNGESRASIVAKMGTPNYYAGKCGVIHVPDKRCALEYVYSHPFAPLIPEYYIVSFSTDDRVVEADQWRSP
jgi:hypothetical protein